MVVDRRHAVKDRFYAQGLIKKKRREKLYGSNVGGASPVCGDIQT